MVDEMDSEDEGTEESEDASVITSSMEGSEFQRPTSSPGPRLRRGRTKHEHCMSIDIDAIKSILKKPNAFD